MGTVRRDNLLTPQLWKFSDKTAVGETRVLTEDINYCHRDLEPLESCWKPLYAEFSEEASFRKTDKP